MRRSVRKRAAGAAAAVGAALLLGGPAVSLALDAGQAATTSPVTDSTSQPARESAPASASVQGTNPHGQGTAVAVSVGGKEAVVVGRSRGEARPDGTYHGHTTTLGLFGNDVIANDTGPGQTAKGPLAPLQEQVLDQICSGSNGNLCVDVLRADSATTGSGSANHSRLAGVTLGGPNGANATVADSNGNIQSNGDCQQAHGDVTLLKLVLGGNPLLDIGESASDSNSCPSGTTVTNSSNPLVAIGGQAIPLPGCGANSPGNLVDLGPLVTIACNAGAATGAGGIVNDALAGTVLAGASGPVATLSGAGTGASAQAPSQGVLGVRQTGSSSPASSKKKGSSTGANRGNGTDKKDGNGEKAPASAVASRPLPAEQAGKLPYTGSDVVLALLVASCLLAAGLGLRRLTARTGVH
jgi:hypothetical protein